MWATIIAWITGFASLFGLGFALYKYGAARQAKKDAALVHRDLETTLNETKERTNREKDINAKPLPMDTNSVIDRLPE